MILSDKIQVRYIVCFIGWFTLLTMYTYRSNMSIAILAMSPQTLSNSSKSYSSCSLNHSLTSKNHQLYEFDWNQKEQGLILSSFFFGYVTTHFIGSVLSFHFGLRNVMTLCLIGSTLFTFLMIPFARLGFSAFLFSRIMIGVFSGPLYPIIHELVGSYAHEYERTALVSMTHTGNIIGLSLNLGLGGYIVDKFSSGWTYLFYMNGSLGIVNIILWLSFVYSSPNENPLMSEKEKLFIIGGSSNISLHKKRTLKDVPFKQIFTSIPVNMICITNFGNNIILYALLTGLPKYISGLYEIGKSMSCILSIIPFILNTISVLIYPRIFNYETHKNNMTITTYRKISTAIAFTFSNLFLAAAGFIPCSLWLTITFFSLSLIFLAPNQSGFFTAMVDLSHENSGITMGVASTSGSIGGIIQPMIVSYFIKSGDKKEGYKLAFLATSALSFITGLAFIIFGSSEKQDWKTSNETEMKQKSVEINNTKLCS